MYQTNRRKTEKNEEKKRENVMSKADYVSWVCRNKSNVHYASLASFSSVLG